MTEFSAAISRRQAIAAAAVTAFSFPSLAGQNQNEHWIDAHSHIWTSDISRFPLREGVTPAELAPKDFTDQQLMEIAGPEGVDRVVLIQHHPYHGFDNSYLLDAARHPTRFRIVGMIDDRLPHADQRMKELLPQKVTGFRIGPRSDHPHWAETDGLNLMWKTAAETGQSMCCLINPADIPLVQQLCRRNPDTPVVIDHFARIGMDGIIRETDLTALCGLAQFPHVKVKISAFYAMGAKSPPYLDLIPMIKRLLDAFGSHRLMWASDCPYQLGDGNSYAASIGLIRDQLDFLSATERFNLLRNTADATFFVA